MKEKGCWRQSVREWILVYYEVAQEMFIYAHMPFSLLC